MLTHGAAVRAHADADGAGGTCQAPPIGLHQGHDHGHGHGGAAAHAAGRRRDARALGIVLALTAGFAVLELVGGLVAGSVALVADAAHMGSDAAALALALGAVWIARRPPTTRMSFGWRRAEILAALVNGVALVAIGI
jgi:cobalt-zinc-cadmium efflux system protein